jgi:hypothetical protein
MHGIAKVHITKPYVISGQAKELALAHVVVVHAALPVLAISLYFSFLLRRGAPAWIAGMDCGHLFWERESGGPVIEVAEAS